MGHVKLHLFVISICASTGILEGVLKRHLKNFIVLSLIIFNLNSALNVLIVSYNRFGRVLKGRVSERIVDFRLFLFYSSFYHYINAMCYLSVAGRDFI